MKRLLTLIILLLQCICGAAQIKLASDINPGPLGSSMSFVIYNNTLYLGLAGGMNYAGLFVFDKNKGTATKLSTYFNGWCEKPVVANNVLYYGASDQSAGNGQEFASYDGINPPVIIKDINKGPNSSSPGNFVTYNSIVYFTAWNRSDSLCFYSYDPGTQLLTNLSSLFPLGVLGDNPRTTLYKNKVLLNAVNANGQVADLYAYDPLTGSATKINTAGVCYNAKDFTELNGILYFSGRGIVDGRELYSYDGVNAPTRLTNLGLGVTDGVDSGGWSNIGAYNNKLYFSGSVNGADYYLYEYDPSNGNTKLVSNNGFHPQLFVTYHNKVYYSAGLTNALKTKPVLFSYDGTTTQTVDTTVNYVAFKTVFDDNLYLSGANKTYGSELFYYNDTATSITNAMIATAVKLYPNPANKGSSIVINLKEAISMHVILTDATGKVVYRQETKEYSAGEHKVDIDVHGLATGIYYIKLNSGERLVWSGKVVKE